jgi:hypothetical protein
MKKGLLFLISLLASTGPSRKSAIAIQGYDPVAFFTQGIGAENRSTGIAPVSAWRVWRDWKSFAAQASEFPVAD